MKLRENIARVIECALADHGVDDPSGQLAYADDILGLIGNPGDLGDCPRYAAGLYSRSNIEQFAADAMEAP